MYDKIMPSKHPFKVLSVDKMVVPDVMSVVGHFGFDFWVALSQVFSRMYC